jgi:predicted RNA-binding protein (virulence factor B family)
LQTLGAFVDPGIPKNLVVDTTELSASDAASLIALKLGIKPPN